MSFEFPSVSSASSREALVRSLYHQLLQRFHPASANQNESGSASKWEEIESALLLLGQYVKYWRDEPVTSTETKKKHKQVDELVDEMEDYFVGQVAQGKGTHLSANVAQRMFDYFVRNYSTHHEQNGTIKKGQVAANDRTSAQYVKWFHLWATFRHNSSLMIRLENPALSTAGQADILKRLKAVIVQYYHETSTPVKATATTVAAPPTEFDPEVYDTLQAQLSAVKYFRAHPKAQEAILDVVRTQKELVRNKKAQKQLTASALQRMHSIPVDLADDGVKMKGKKSSPAAKKQQASPSPPPPSFLSEKQDFSVLPSYSPSYTSSSADREADGGVDLSKYYE